MYRLQNLKIAGYRRWRSIDVEMRDLNVIIGPNAVGKTSFLDALSLLAASANGKLLDTIKGGINELLTRGQADSLDFQLSVNIPNQLSVNIANHQPLNYYLQIFPARGSGYEISQETLSQNSNSSAPQTSLYISSHHSDIKYFSPADQHLIRPNWEHNPFETSLSQIPKMYEQPEKFRQQLASCTFYKPLDVGPRSPIRLPQEMRPAKLPGMQGESLVACLYQLRETNADRFEIIQDILRTNFPGFTRLNFPPVAAGMLTMTWQENSFPQPIYIHELSEGTLRFLWLVTLLQSPDLTAMTLIDEPEISLHPELLRSLAYLMREASQRSQLVVATHSERLIRFLEPKEVLVCNLEDGETSMNWADSFDLDKWLVDYGLDEIWRMNLIGGRP